MQILYLCPSVIWNRRVSASRRHDVEAVARHGGVKLHWSGQGWPDWDDNQTAVNNVRRIMPNVDACWCYKLHGTKVSGVTVPPAKDVGELGSRHLVVEKQHRACHPLPDC